MVSGTGGPDAPARPKATDPCMPLLTWIMLAALATVVGTTALSLANLRRYRWRTFFDTSDLPDTSDTPTGPHAAADSLVSICIPARDEQHNIETCVRSLLAQDWPRLEVLVYDDQSTDRTPAILSRLADQDERVKLVPTRPLPEGWNGKQHACWLMGQAASGSWLLFTDADVRFEPGCIRAAATEAEARNLALLSTFPRQIVKSLGEALLIPMIFFLLFSYLPMGRMRRTRDPSASAGCGQFLFVRADAYAASGGHAAFKDSMHDGIMMPRAMRRAGLATDLFDGTSLCSVRMYHGWTDTWRGFAKNAYEGLGSVALLAFLTLLHILAHILPWLVVIAAGLLIISGRDGDWPLGLADPRAALFAILAIVIAIAQRAVLVERFRHPMWLALAHPICVVLMTAVQWHSFVLHLMGRRAWRGRTQGRPGVAGG